MFKSQRIERTFGAVAHGAHHMGVDHGGFNALVAEQLLHLANIHPLHQQMGRKTVTQRMHRNSLGNIRNSRRVAQRPLKNLLAHMMPASNSALRINRKILRRKNILPFPFGWGV